MIGQKVFLVERSQIRTGKLSQERERALLHHILMVLALISRPNEVRRHIRVSAEAGGSQIPSTFAETFFQLNAVFTQRLQFFYYVHVNSSMLNYQFCSSLV